MKYYIFLICLFLGVSVDAQRIGELITNSDGSKGIVFWVKPDGSGGWMVALHDLESSVWGGGTDDIPDLENISGADEQIRVSKDISGYENTAAIRSYLGTGSISVFQKVDFEHGWYIPAMGQLKKLRSVWPLIKSMAIKNGGSDMEGEEYWSSTEESGVCAWGWEPLNCPEKFFKGNKRPSRPIRSFNYTDITYRWNTGATTSVIKERPVVMTEYTVVVSSGGGHCSDKDRKKVFVASNDPVDIFDTICKGQVYNRNGFSDMTTPGTYPLELEGANGCKVSLTLQLMVADTFSIALTDRFCAGEIYSGYNFTASEAGIYTQTWRAANGCDSVVTLDLKMEVAQQENINDTICAGEVYTAHGFQASTAGDHTLMLQSVSGCDSLLRLHLTVNPRYEDDITASICVGEVYTAHGFQASTAGDHTLMLQSVSGCDSLLRLHLTVKPSYFFTETAAICAGESYLFRGINYREQGVYNDPFLTKNGCDSIYQLQLNVHPVYDTLIDMLICEGERYTANGFDVREAGDYTQRLQSCRGCDSIVRLKLQVVAYFNGAITSSLEDCMTHKYRFSTGDEVLSDWVTPVYDWDFGDGESSSELFPYHAYADSGSYAVALTVTTGHSCGKTLSFRRVVPYYTEDFEIYADPAAVDSQESIVKFQTECLPGMKYRWDFGDGAVGDDCLPVHRYDVVDQHFFEVKLLVTNSEDCSVERNLRITAYPVLEIPNTFSPNADGINDVFMKDYRVQIMNRNGVKIYDGTNGWDGSYNGKQVPEDTYFYHLYYVTTRGEKIKNGYITLAR